MKNNKWYVQLQNCKSKSRAILNKMIKNDGSKKQWVWGVALSVVLVAVFSWQNMDLWTKTIEHNEPNYVGTVENYQPDEKYSPNNDLVNNPHEQNDVENNHSDMVLPPSLSSPTFDQENPRQQIDEQLRGKQAEQQQLDAEDIVLPALPVDSESDEFLLPAAGTWDRQFGFAYDKTYEDYRFHNGADMNLRVGELVAAVMSGTVKEVGESKSKGGYLIISHDNQVESAYYGITPNPLQVGAVLQKGDAIGTVAPAPLFETEQNAHLHLEIKVNNQYVDPIKFLSS